ncbi:hypothetical protein F4678DRAFT_461581 [Xylaria arbuscula]|nr:hypothetical protein F4678DRAFT_461581 [Xylaria arbuscula]
MSGSGGFYKYRCGYFYTHECPNWVYVNNTGCAECSAMGRDANPAASQVVRSWPSSSDHMGDRAQAHRSRSTEVRPLIIRRIDQAHSDSAQEWHIAGTVNGVSVDILADSGSTINSMSKDEADRVGATVDPDTAGGTIRLPSGETFLSLGVVAVGFTFEGEEKISVLHCTIVGTLEWAMIVGYDFLKTTETLTRFRDQRIRQVSPSDLYRMPLSLMVEDNTVSDGSGARMEGFINGIRTTVVPDTGSAIIAMSTSYADRQGLEIDATRRKEVTFVDGSTALTRGIVKGTWVFLNPDPDVEPHTSLVNHLSHQVEEPVETTERRYIYEDTDAGRDPWDYVWEYEWHVIDGLPVDAVLNLDFIKRHDVFNKHQHSFIRPPFRCKIPEILGICELPGGCKGLVNLAEAFVADLTSPDPFSYNMILRESARRSEIQRTILNLPDNLQSAQRDIEKRRIADWNSIKDFKDRGEDWQLLRDQYVGSLRLQSAQMPSLQSPAVRGDTSNDGKKGKKRKFWHRHS